MILDFSNKWPVGKILKVNFVNGKEKLNKKVMEVAKQWEEYANIHFEFVKKSEESEITVKFNTGKNDSKIGADALTFGNDEPIVCFDTLHENSPIEDVNKYVLHEFGHVLGFIHEHLHPLKKINWIREKAIEHYYKNYNYSVEDCEKNLFRKYMPSSLIYAEFDPNSIMMYPIPSDITDDGESFIMNSELTDIDKKMARLFYPSIEPEIINISPDNEKFIEGELKDSYRYNIYKFPFDKNASSKCYVEADTEGDEEITLALYSVESENIRKGCINYILPNEEYQGGKGNKPRLETYPSTIGDLYLKVAHLNPLSSAKYKLKVYFL